MRQMMNMVVVSSMLALWGLALASPDAAAQQAPIESGRAVVLGADGDYISGGTDTMLAFPDDDFSIRVGFGERSQVIIARAGGWQFEFAAPNDAPLVAGDAFTDAAGFNSFDLLDGAGLALTAPGRSCSDSVGDFEILELTVAADSGIIETFAADFRYTCNGGRIGGGIRINTSLADPNVLDSDSDGVANALDNCLSDANADQADLDRDASGDACDTYTLTSARAVVYGVEGDQVTRGSDATIIYPESLFMVGALYRDDFDRGIKVSADGWTFEFDAPDGAPVAEGDAFAGLPESGFQPVDTGALAINSPTHPCFASIGSFEVFELTFDPETGNIATFAVDFRQSCYGEPELAGGIRINSDRPDPPPLDTDEDGVINDEDNCPFIANTDQSDLDGDRIGDVCDDSTIVSSRLVVLGEQGDWITAGRQYDSAVVRFGPRNSQPVFKLSVSGIGINVGFDAPDDLALAEGDVFIAATRSPFNASGVAGLSVGSPGRGCNKILGEFEVLELTFFSPDGPIRSFASDFRYSCDGGPVVAGGARVNSALDGPDILDSDLDGILNADDNCLSVSNPEQLDTDGDEFGDACDRRLDGDINCDGDVTVVDALALVRARLDLIPSVDFCSDAVDSEVVLENGDLDVDGGASTKDAMIILECLVRTPNEFCPAG